MKRKKSVSITIFPNTGTFTNLQTISVCIDDDDDYDDSESDEIIREKSFFPENICQLFLVYFLAFFFLSF